MHEIHELENDKLLEIIFDFRDLVVDDELLRRCDSKKEIINTSNILYSVNWFAEKAMDKFLAGRRISFWIVGLEHKTRKGEHLYKALNGVINEFMDYVGGDYYA